MNRLRYSSRALADLERLSDLLLASDPVAAADTVGLIFETIEILRHSPEIGRKVSGTTRELVISRGRSGCLALYRFFPATGQVLVLAIRHQREAGYQSA
jgi:plasmid stabilization system protein ParE